MGSDDRLYDDWLVLRCQGGDADALGELVTRWQDRLWRHARRLTGEEAAAWDVLQESWLAISRNLRGLADTAAFPAWAYQIVTNKSREHCRREARSGQRLADYREQSTRPDSDAAEAQRREDHCATVQEAIARLPGQDQALLALYYQDQFSVSLIAEILDIPSGTVKSRLHHARERLRRLLEAQDHER